MGQRNFIALVREDLARLFERSSKPQGISLWLRVFHPRFVPVLFLRCAGLFHESWLLRPLSFVFSMLNLVLFGLEVTPRSRIGGGLFLPHTQGTVIGAAEIGRNATIFQGVTIGAKFADTGFDRRVRPTLGDDVLVGAGAKVLGAISIGSRAIIAANSLVLDNVPAGAHMIGVPAKERHPDE